MNTTAYDFDQIIDRQGTGDLKHEALLPRWGRKDLLPLWVADMDWACPDFIIDALRQRLEHPILGYTVEPPELWPTVTKWIESHHAWRVEREWLRFVPGIVKGIGIAINVLTHEGDKVMIQPPVYHPFRLTPEGNGRQVVYNPLRRGETHYYEVDWEDFERKVQDCKLFILCNPHNPAGICWDRETLARMAEICYAHGVVVLSDEIHCDMALWGHRHTPFASVSDKAAAISITFQAPTKTFNIAGLISAYAIVPNPLLRQKFYRWLQVNELDEATLFAPIATVAAFRHGEDWRRAMLSHVEANVRWVEEYCQRELPAIRPVRPEASFLLWLDCTQLGLSHEALLDLFIDKAHLALNDGAMFGQEGLGYMRLNVGTPRATLRQAFLQLREAVATLSRS